MKTRPAILLCALLPLLLCRLGSQGIPPSPDRYVTDKAGFLSAEARENLERRLESFARSSGKQFIIYIDRTTGGVPIEDWAVRAFEAWKVGQKGLDNGIALFVFSEERRLRIEVGYGLEGVVTDAQAGRIINDVIAPRLRENRPDEAMAEAVDAVMAAVTGKAPPGEESGNPPGERVQKKLSPFQLFFAGLLALGFLILLVTHPGLAIWLLFNILSGGRGGGSGSGGFSGGGGRSGGGGASGSW